MRRSLVSGAALVALALAPAGHASADRPRSNCTPAGAAGRVSPSAPATPFVENAGQWGADVAFASEGGAFILGGTSMTVVHGRAAAEFAFEGARASTPRGEQQARAMHHYFRGRGGPFHARTFSRVTYPEAWTGIDLVFDAHASAAEYSLVVAPGADAGAARFRVARAERVERDAGGGLVVTTRNGRIEQSRPVAWQDLPGRRVAVEVEFEIGPRADDGSWTYGFALGAHDASHAVVVDPYFWYDKFIVAARIEALAIDAQGRVYAAGSSSRPEAVDPLGGTFDTSFAGRYDGWVARFDAGGAMEWATYLGGGFTPETTFDNDGATEIAVTADGEVVVAGFTSSPDFPLAGGPLLGVQVAGPGRTAWLARLSGDGKTLLHSGIVGGSDVQLGVGADGAAYVAWGPYLAPSLSRVSIPESGGIAVTSVARVSREGAVERITELRGPDAYAWTLEDLAVDAAGAVHLCGTAHRTFALPPAALTNSWHGGSDDAFSMKLAPDGGSLEHALYIGGTLSDYVGAVVLDSAGTEHLVGATLSSLATFPRTVDPATGTSEFAPGRAFIATVPSSAADGVSVLALGSADSPNKSLIGWYYTVAIDARERVFALARGQMWRLDPDGTIEAYTGSQFDRRPVVDASGVIWYGSNRLTRRAEEALGAPEVLDAVAISADSVRFSWFPYDDDATSAVVERAAATGPFADIATLPGDAVVFVDDAGLAPDTVYRYRVRTVSDGIDSLRSEVESIRTAGTLRLRVLQRRTRYRSRIQGDSVRASASFAPIGSSDVDFDPETDAVRVTVGAFALDVAAGDPGWTRQHGKDVWTGPAYGGEVTLRIDLAQRTFRVSGSQLELPPLLYGMPVVSLRLGEEAGSVVKKRRGGRR